jgi:hypothetical protein
VIGHDSTSFVDNRSANEQFNSVDDSTNCVRHPLRRRKTVMVWTLRGLVLSGRRLEGIAGGPVPAADADDKRHRLMHPKRDLDTMAPGTAWLMHRIDPLAAQGCPLGWVSRKHPAVPDTTELCETTKSKPIVNAGWAANHQKHEPQKLRRGVTKMMWTSRTQKTIAKLGGAAALIFAVGFTGAGSVGSTTAATPQPTARLRRCRQRRRAAWIACSSPWTSG